MKKDIREYRHQLQKKLREYVLAEVKQNTTSTGLSMLEQKYFIDEDPHASSMNAVRQEIASIMRTVTPFSEIANGEYFNALYNKDYVKLRALDNRYLQKIKPLINSQAQYAAALAPLIDGISGQKKGTTQHMVNKGIRNLSVLHAIMGTYLFQYQKYNQKCLKLNAVTLTVSNRTDTVTVDGFGNEISRVKGWTTKDHYTINPEFKNNFQQLFGAAIEPAVGQLFDLFLNDGNMPIT